MDDSLAQEKKLLTAFLSAYKIILEARTGIPFNPRSVTVLNQPNLKNERHFEWTSYNKFFDEVDLGVYKGTSNNIIEAFLEVPINILITAESIGKPLLNKQDQQKLAKALRLISEIKINKIYGKKK